MTTFRKSLAATAASLTIVLLGTLGNPAVAAQEKAHKQSAQKEKISQRATAREVYCC